MPLILFSQVLVIIPSTEGGNVWLIIRLSVHVKVVAVPACKRLGCPIPCKRLVCHSACKGLGCPCQCKRLGCPQDDPISYMGGQTLSIFHGVNVTTANFYRKNCDSRRGDVICNGFYYIDSKELFMAAILIDIRNYMS